MQDKLIKRSSVKVLLGILLFLVLVQGVQAEKTVTVLAKWGNTETENDFFSSASDIAVDSSGNIYVADTGNNRIQKFSPEGTFITKWGSLGIGDGELEFPRGIAVDSSDTMYVADTGNNRIQKFSPAGAFLGSWGGLDVVADGKSIRSGHGDGEFDAPRGIAVDSSGNIYVADTLNHRIQKFSPDGTFITKWGSYGTGTGQFNQPWGVAVDSSGEVYVADTLNNRIQKFSSSGTYISTIGRYGLGTGQFNQPRGVAVDSSDDVYVADTENSRIQKFSSTGEFLGTWGSLIDRDGLVLGGPNAIEVDSSGTLYIIEGPRAQKFVIRTSATTQTTSLTTRQTTRQTTRVTAAPTLSRITPNNPAPSLTPAPGIDAATVQEQLEEQIRKIDPEGNLLDQITHFFKDLFGWK